MPHLLSKARGQITFEYLLITAAFFSFMLILVGPLEQALDTAIFSIDVISAENFSERILSSSKSLSMLGAGSTKKIESGVLTEWRLFRDSGGAFLEVTSTKLGKAKKFPIQISADFPEMSFTKNAYIILTNDENGLSINPNSNLP